MKITLLSLIFLILFFNLKAQNNKASPSKHAVVFERQYKNKHNQPLTFQIKRSLSNPLHANENLNPLLLVLDAQHFILLEVTHKEKISNFLRASLLKNNCTSTQPTLTLGNNFKLRLVASAQECYYLLEIGKQQVTLPFGEGLTLLRKLIIFQKKVTE